VGVIALAALAVLRPDRWAATWRRLLAALRGSGWAGDDDGFDRLEPLDEDATGSGRAGIGSGTPSSVSVHDRATRGRRSCTTTCGRPAARP
jgi:hypothetical protein